MIPSIGKVVPSRKFSSSARRREIRTALGESSALPNKADHVQTLLIHVHVCVSSRETSLKICFKSMAKIKQQSSVSEHGLCR